ncbi:hypothetical protein E3N88_39742 [Mikania micrantha]|uniref:Uncharacterized protein n=1 Tax=Mikania micrantha TaxID=192012 RepID=A0A5N6LKN8_9ASTR|nr:hypothetical protein E3N88_39742 [Mikania micrantha]
MNWMGVGGSMHKLGFNGPWYDVCQGTVILNSPIIPLLGWVYWVMDWYIFDLFGSQTLAACRCTKYQVGNSSVVDQFALTGLSLPGQTYANFLIMYSWMVGLQHVDSDVCTITRWLLQQWGWVMNFLQFWGKGYLVYNMRLGYKRCGLLMGWKECGNWCAEGCNVDPRVGQTKVEFYDRPSVSIAYPMWIGYKPGNLGWTGGSHYYWYIRSLIRGGLMVLLGWASLWCP